MPEQLTIIESKPLPALTIVASKPLQRSLDQRQGTSALGYKPPKDDSWSEKFMEGAAKGTLMPLGPPIQGMDDAIARAKNLPGALWNTVKNALSGDPETLGQLASGAPYALAGGGESAIGSAVDAVRPAAQAAKNIAKSAMEKVAVPGTGTMAMGAAETASGLAAMAHGNLAEGAIAAADGARRVMSGLEKRRASISEKLATAHAQAAPVQVEAPASIAAQPPAATVAHVADLPTIPVQPEAPAPVAPEVQPSPAPAPIEAGAAWAAERARISKEESAYRNQSPGFAAGLEQMRARRRNASADVQPDASSPAPMGSQPESIPLEPTPRSRGELPKGSGQQTLGFAPKSFEAGARDAKMMDLADAASAAGITSKDLASMTKEQRQMLADIATNMRVQLVMEEKGIPIEAARQLVKPIKGFSADTTGLLLKELNRREVMLKK